MAPPLFPLQTHLPGASRLVLGCMGLGGSWDDAPVGEEHLAQGQAALEAAQAAGITLFDHADIYTRGKAERVFGELFRRQPSLRDNLLLQTKCGIRFADDRGPGRYDLSRDYIVQAAEASLVRLNTDHIDLLLLHRPDALMNPAEVAEAFGRLRSAGKVKYFGVSNMHAGQIRWLSQALGTPLIANQLEMSLAKLDWLDAGTCFNDGQAAGALPWADTLQHCQQQRIQLQAWAPLAKGGFSGSPPSGASPAQQQTAARVAALADQHQAPPEAIVLAWLLQHPAAVQPVIGTTQPGRIAACGEAARVALTREEWYALYVSSRGRALP